MTKETLSEKEYQVWIDVYEKPKIRFKKKDVKEKVQNAQRRLKAELSDDQGMFGVGVEEAIDKIFKEEFGGKLNG